jgi:hypothetical protein
MLEIKPRLMLVLCEESGSQMELRWLCRREERAKERSGRRVRSESRAARGRENGPVPNVEGSGEEAFKGKSL